MVPSEAILLVLQAAYIGKGGEIFVLDMGKPVKILDLAETLIKLAGFEPYKDIPIVFTEASPGEKLFEEILSRKEHMHATSHEKIFMTPQTFMPQNKKIFFEGLEELIVLAKKGHAQEALKLKIAKLISLQEAG